MANTHSLDLELSSSQYAFVADNVALSSPADLSIECWINLEQLPSTAGLSFGLVTKDDTTSREYNFGFNTSDILECYYWNASGFTGCDTDTAMVVSGDVGNWVHIAVTVDTSTQTFVFYKNASSVGSTNVATAANSIRDQTADFAIGARSDGANYFDGLIDEVRIWNDVRTGTEISNNYQTELIGDEAGIIGYWKLNNDYTDSTASGNDLTASGSPVFSTNVPFSTTTFKPRIIIF